MNIRTILYWVAMPFVDIGFSPLAQSEARISFREWGSGPAVLFLHGGWGYDFYPVTSEGLQLIVPDRSGYGQSTRPAVFGPNFHKRAVEETLLFLDAINLKKPLLWGHSDGAVIAAILAIDAPERCAGVVLEAFHFFRDKPQSRDFFREMASHPRASAPRASAALGPELIAAHAQAWLDIAALGGDLYDGRLPELSVPTLVLHGERDPRTEPGELDAVRAALPAAEFHVLQGAGHSPHSESAHAGESNTLIKQFVERVN